MGEAERNLRTIFESGVVVLGAWLGERKVW